MKAKNVEKDSPAEAHGKLKPGQIIESIKPLVECHRKRPDCRGLSKEMTTKSIRPK